MLTWRGESVRIGLAATNPIERFFLASGKAPVPFFDTWFTFLFARAIMAGTQLGIFEALEEGPLAATDVSSRCRTEPRDTRTLLDALVSSGYLRLDGSRYALASIARRWLLKQSPTSLRDIVLHRFLDWKYVDELEEHVRTGRPLDIHQTMSDEAWGVYQRGMRSIAGMAADETVKKTPVPAGARDMLDVGGSHGYYSVLLCRRHPGLRSVVLDLPEAVSHAAPLLAAEGMGDRVVHRPGKRAHGRPRVAGV